MPAPDPRPAPAGEAAGRSRARVVVAVVLAVLAPVAALAFAVADAAHDRPAQAAVAASPSSPAPAVPSPTSSLPPLPDSPGPPPTSATAVPVRLEIPAIGVDTGLEDLGLEPDGRLATPSDWPTAGWYAGGVRPGDPGPAIVAGHVDSYRGPAVFFRLDRLRAGDTAVVTRADGTRLTFVVESAARYPKADFPTSEVYGPTPTPVLELITCTGVFDRAARSYEDNLVVTTTLRTGA